MELTGWPPEHCDALRDHLAKGLTFAEAAHAINGRFGTLYSRSAALGRARRMGLMGEERPKPTLPASPPNLRRIESVSAEPVALALRWPTPAFEAVKPEKLRCVGIEPRHVALIDLAREDCRYPYGGDQEGETITFCGHPRRTGSSYCTPHFDLSRNPIEPPEHLADADADAAALPVDEPA